MKKMNKDETMVINKLMLDPKRNINMINFISNYGIDFLYQSNTAIMISGFSDKQWVYIDAETKSDFNKIVDKLMEFEYFAVFNDNQYKWLSEIMELEVMLSCKKYIFPKDIELEESNLVSVIDESYTQYIFDNYEYREFVDIDYLKNQIKNNLALGIFDNEKLVAWIMTHDDGAMGFLTVLPNYRNRGYATLLSNAYIKHLREKGVIPFIHIEEHNIKSLNLAKKCGFKYYGNVHWIKRKK